MTQLDYGGALVARKPSITLGAILGVIVVVQSLWAADHRNLEEGIPTEIEDASPIAFRSFEQQSRFKY